jgi:SPX domain protein involved in polyphosphate accumulation
MSFRIEEKLFIKKENLSDFKKFLFTKKIKKIFNSRYIESVYFDNLNLDMYNDSIEGLLPRKKIRLRLYPNTTDKNYYFETKISSIEGRFKNRKIINLHDFKSMINLGIVDTKYGSCFPVIEVKYFREYYLAKDVRISIDDNIVYKNNKTKFKIEDNNIAVELKTNINKDLDQIIKDFPFQRIRFSKYCYGIEKLNIL